MWIFRVFRQWVCKQTRAFQSYVVILDLQLHFQFPSPLFSMQFQSWSYLLAYFCLFLSQYLCLSLFVCFSVILSVSLFLCLLSPPSVCLASCLDMSSMYTGTYYIHVCSEYWSLSVSVPLFVCPCVSVSACVCLSLSLCLSVCVCLSLSLSVLPFHNNNDCHFVN